MTTNKDIINQKIYEKWGPEIQGRLKSKGVLDRVNEVKQKKIAKLCHTRKQLQRVSESVYATPSSTPGRGAFSFGNNPGTGSDTSVGSGEVFSNLFGLFVDTAATTFGMDMLPIIPMSKSNVNVYIYEPIYADGKITASATANKVFLFQVAITATLSPTALVVGTEYTVKSANSGGENVMKLTYLGKERIKGLAVFKVGDQYDNSGASGTNWQTSTIAASLTSPNRIYTDASNYFTFDATTVDYVSAFNNWVNGFTASGSDDTAAMSMNRSDGTIAGGPNTRETAEGRTFRSMGLRQYHKNFSAKTHKVDMEYTLEQIQDAKMDMDTDAIELGDAAMQDQLSQSINDYVIGKIASHGWSNHYQMYTATGFNMNLSLGTSAGSSHTYKDENGTSRTIAGPSGSLPSSGAISENLSTIQRRIITRLLYGAVVTNTRCRKGRADEAILNGTHSTAVQDIKGFKTAEFESEVNDNGLANIGKFNKISVFEDSLDSLTGERIHMARHGNDGDPGLKMCTYLLAYKTETVAEGSGAPKHYLMSRYEVVGVGSQPQLNYLSFTVQQDAGYKVV